MVIKVLLDFVMVRAFDFSIVEVLIVVMVGALLEFVTVRAFLEFVMVIVLESVMVSACVGIGICDG